MIQAYQVLNIQKILDESKYRHTRGWEIIAFKSDFGIKNANCKKQAQNKKVRGRCGPSLDLNNNKIRDVS